MIYNSFVNSNHYEVDPGSRRTRHLARYQSGNSVGVDVHFDSTGLELGEYYGTIEPIPSIPVLVTLQVLDIDLSNNIYLPLIVR